MAACLVMLRVSDTSDSEEYVESSPLRQQVSRGAICVAFFALVCLLALLRLYMPKEVPDVVVGGLGHLALLRLVGNEAEPEYRHRR